MTTAIKEGSSDLDKEMGSYTSTQIERGIIITNIIIIIITIITQPSQKPSLMFSI